RHGEGSARNPPAADTCLGPGTWRLVGNRPLRDRITHSDCYMSLWLPTASFEKVRTKTIHNCKDPVWNETFYFRIQPKVKNVLELSAYDEDNATHDDHLFSVLFDVARIPLGERIHMCFKSEKLVSSELTGGVSREVCCLEVHVDEKKKKRKHKSMLKLAVSNNMQCVSSQRGLDVRLGYDLCPEDQDFLCKRKMFVAAALENILNLKGNLHDHEVPVVAIMTTGGGLRSLTTAYGSLLCLKKLNLLDCATYLTCLSGTTWTMANLYRDAYWSQSQKDLAEQIKEARRQVTKCKLSCFSVERMKYYKKQLDQRTQEGHRTSFIDAWGLIVECLLNDEKVNHKLSDQREALNEGQNPLPIYTALNVKDQYSTLDFREWMEFTPYEVGFLKYGAFVRSEDFGSEFFMGRMIKRLPETRICYMEGMWSSIFSFNLLYLLSLSDNSEDFWHRWTRDRITDIEEEPILSMKPDGEKTRLLIPADPVSRALRSAVTDRLSLAQYHNFLKGLQMHDSYIENSNFCRWKDTVLDSSPNHLTQTTDYLSLVDTGFFINTSTPPLLRPERKVDVILHLNYSAGSQILPLEQSCKYYMEQGIPFPKVVLSEDDRENLKECYIFGDSESPEAPILLFFPLVNDTFRYYKAPGVRRSSNEMAKGEVDVSSSSSPYSTYAVSYSEENFDKLLELTEYNILNNQHMILQALHMALQRKRQQKR
uniref:Phospholipase A2 n=1 Tax=Sphenodon punctatus TaxID=8508 RepID=A0A8D0HBB1_SPHPU